MACGARYATSEKVQGECRVHGGGAMERSVSGGTDGASAPLPLRPAGAQDRTEDNERIMTERMCETAREDAARQCQSARATLHVVCGVCVCRIVIGVRVQRVRGGVVRT